MKSEYEESDSTICQQCWIDLKSQEALHVHASLCHPENKVLKNKLQSTVVKIKTQLDCKNLPFTSLAGKPMKRVLIESNQEIGKSFSYTNYFHKNCEEIQQQRKIIEEIQKQRMSAEKSLKNYNPLRVLFLCRRSM
uniref:C2H2-type domain-containing protein n=1 Tax=Acrobeloides nanus TaxID=290746 RepID=A0A914CNL3_9BILA